MRFAPEANHGANAGLINGRNKLEPVKAQFPNISYSDLWTLAGVVGIQEMGGPKVRIAVNTMTLSVLQCFEGFL